MPKIVSIGTALPPHKILNEEAKMFAKKLFSSNFPEIDRYLSIFDHTSIEQRFLSQPVEWFADEQSFSERNRLYCETAVELGENAIRDCLKKTGISAEEIDQIVFVSTSGISTPSIEARLVHRLQMREDVLRTPIWGLGCAGGVAGLQRAFQFAKANARSKVLLLAVELCSLTFRKQDLSKSNLVATSLFADGAAAVLVVGDEVETSAPSPHYVAGASRLWPDTLDIMGWKVKDDGLQVVFSRDIPSFVRTEAAPFTKKFLEDSLLDLEQIRAWIFHPGGRKVLEAYQDALHLLPDHLADSYAVLRQYGNMSSVTVLFVLKNVWLKGLPEGSYGLMSALGPGFTSELVLLRWER
jgi:alkylresorcinol/alkylpyrone synthase